MIDAILIIGSFLFFAAGYHMGYREGTAKQRARTNRIIERMLKL